MNRPMFIGLGTWACDDATEQNAIDNMLPFVAECLKKHADEAVITRRPDLDEDGRFGFAITWRDGAPVEVQMPGWPLERVRWQSDSQDILAFPRLYVDGSSWLWPYAVSGVRDDLVWGTTIELEMGRKVKAA